MSTLKLSARRPRHSELRFPAMLRNASAASIEFIAPHCEVLRLPKGTKIRHKHEQRTHWLFLLRGDMLLKDANGTVQTIQGDSARARFALISDEMTDVQCLCRQETRLLRIPREMLQRANSAPAAFGSAHSSPQAEELERTILQDFQEAIKNGSLELPAMPGVAVRIARHIDSHEATSESIARIIQMDPSVTARLIQVANSPVYRGRARIETGKDAVTRLGRSTTRDLVTTFVLKSIFHSRSPLIKGRMKALWQHSTEVAALCHALAKRSPGFDPSQAMLIGLVHDIGIIPILSNAHRYAGLQENRQLLEDITAHLRADFSAMTLRKWGFGPEFIESALDAENWFRNKNPQVDYADLLLIAQLHASVGTPEMANLPRIDEIPAFRKLALGALSPSMSLLVLEEAHQEIEQLKQLIA
jgi:HD-like signal output (HDOD) protein